MTSLREKVGNMLIFGFHGKDFSSDAAKIFLEQVQELKIGGTILFDYNIVSPVQLKRLTDSLKNARHDIVIAVDQEGGEVQRLNAKNGFTDTASANFIASEFNLEQAFMIYKEMAKMLKDHGINMNLAPVVDVDFAKSCPVIGGMNRSFSANALMVSEYADIFVKAHAEHKILTTLKHFPGHGFAKLDSHKGIVDVTNSSNHEIELRPYKILLAKNQYYHHTTVMPAHIINKNIDSTALPATFSKAVINNLLRDKLAFDGVVITDALEMSAIKKHYLLEEAVIKAINAGNDLLLFSNNKAACLHNTELDDWSKEPGHIVEIIMKAVEEGYVSEKRIERSLKRIEKLKKFIMDNDCIATNSSKYRELI